MKAVDYTGQTFWYITLTSRERVRNPTGCDYTMYRGRCVCGKTTNHRRVASLIKGKVKSCGCKRAELLKAPRQRRTMNRIGEVWGDYRIVGPAAGHRKWEVQCTKCLATKTLSFQALKELRPASCCVKRSYELNGLSNAAYQDVFVTYKLGALKRNLSWELSPPELETLITSHCTYCGVPPCRESRISDGIHVNGIDRVDNEIGYTSSNCVPCCQRCNRAKNDASLVDFQAWIDRLISFQSTKQAAASPAA